VGSPGNKRLSLLWQTDRDAAAMEIRIALIGANGSVRKAAEKLRVSFKTVYNWISERPDIKEGY
jgi:hypothetical protein